MPPSCRNWSLAAARARLIVRSANIGDGHGPYLAPPRRFAPAVRRFEPVSALRPVFGCRRPYGPARRPHACARPKVNGWKVPLRGRHPSSTGAPPLRDGDPDLPLRALRVLGGDPDLRRYPVGCRRTPGSRSCSRPVGPHARASPAPDRRPRAGPCGSRGLLRPTGFVTPSRWVRRSGTAALCPQAARPGTLAGPDAGGASRPEPLLGRWWWRRGRCKVRLLARARFAAPAATVARSHSKKS